MLKGITNRQQFLSAEIAKCRKIIDSAPTGKLEIYSNKSATRWYVKPENGSRKYLPKKEFDTAGLLSEKRLAEEKLCMYERELDAINRFLASYPSDEERIMSAKKNAAFLNLTKPKTALSWQNEPFETNTSFPENLKHPSPSGHMLRSKSECLIDMALFNRNIPFRYECKLDFDFQCVYPDFTIYNEATDEFKYWERFGMMDDARYRKKALEKEEFYYSQGLFPGNDLIFTYETIDSPITTIVIDKIIDDIEEWLGR